MNPEDLKVYSLLAEFDTNDRIEFCDLLEAQTLKPGETLFREGDEADSLYLIESGSIRIVSESSGELGLLCAGATLGAVSLMTIGRREVSARAESECKVLALTRADFRRLAEDAPRTACRLAETVVGELANGLRLRLTRIKVEFSSDELVVSG